MSLSFSNFCKNKYLPAGIAVHWHYFPRFHHLLATPLRSDPNGSSPQLFARAMPSHKVPGPQDTETVKHIRNKSKRAEVFGRIKKQKADIKKAKKAKRQKEASENPDAPKRVPKTLDNTREFDETSLAVEDEEILKDVEEDEFQRYFDGEQVRHRVLLCIRM